MNDNGDIAGEYTTAPFVGIGLVIDIAIIGGDVCEVVGKGCPYAYPNEEKFIAGGGNDAESWVRGDSIVVWLYGEYTGYCWPCCCAWSNGSWVRGDSIVVWL